MNRYMPITGFDCLIPSLLIGYPRAPLCAAGGVGFSIRTATQALEAQPQEPITAEAVALHEVSRLAALVLRNGCDLMGVIGLRLWTELSALRPSKDTSSPVLGFDYKS